jgi:hypothetical protein
LCSFRINSDKSSLVSYVNTWQQNPSKIFKVLATFTNCHGLFWNNGITDICTEGTKAVMGEAIGSRN